MVEIVYDPRVSHLEEKVSYGMLGIISAIVKFSDAPANIRSNIFLFNGMTLARNALNQQSDLKKAQAILKYDVEQLQLYYGQYVQQEAHLVFYFHPKIYSMIPEHAQRTLTDTRKMTVALTEQIAQSEKLVPGKVAQVLGKDGKLTTSGILVDREFSYRALGKLVRLTSYQIPKIWMVSHCPIDYLMFKDFANTTLIDSHTGKLTTKRELGSKVWKDERIPFNPTTLKLFGDSDFIKPLVKQRPSALEKLGDIKLKTERELASLATARLGIEPKLLTWSL